MIKYERKDLEIELKKRGQEQYLDFVVLELNLGRDIRDVLKAIAEMDAVDFIRSLQNPQTLYLPERYKLGESEIIISGKEKIEGYLEVNGEAEIIPKCHQNQNPYKRGRILACTDEKEGTDE